MSEEEYKERVERLEKEADWLAARLNWYAQGSPVDSWRELARRAVDKEENRWKDNWYTL